MKGPDRKRHLSRTLPILDEYLKKIGVWKHIPRGQRALIEQYVRIYDHLAAREQREVLRKQGVETFIVPLVQIFLFRNGPEGIEVCLGKRAQGTFQGQWSAPGGKRETGETFEDAALRELREETGLSLERESLTLLNSYTSQALREKDEQRVLCEYRTRAYAVWAGDLAPHNVAPREHSALEWKPIREALRMHAESFSRARIGETENMITPRTLGVVIEFGGYRDVDEAKKIKSSSRDDMESE